MNILFVTDFYKPHIGGVEKLFSSLAEELAAKGDKVTYITWHYDRNLPHKENINKVNIIRISAPSRTFFSLFALLTIIHEARKADLIHTSTYSSAIGSWIASKFTGKRIIITVHEVWGNLWLKMPYLSSFEKSFFRLFEKWLLKLKFDRYIAVSDFTKNKLTEIGIDSQKINRIYNGIDYDLPEWSDPGLPFTFCFFGRAGASKGLDILIKASEMLLEVHPKVRFKFIISPQNRNVFNKVVLRINNGILKEHASIYSQLPYPALITELMSSNCIIIPSLSEGFGFTAVEASAMGIPIISSGMGSLPEVTSGKVITIKKYSAESLYTAMEISLANRFEIVPQKKFTIETFIESHYSLYLKQ
jgi:glycosyltransferase involved in cell wall biosynthesis